MQRTETVGLFPIIMFVYILVKKRRAIIYMTVIITDVLDKTLTCLFSIPISEKRIKYVPRYIRDLIKNRMLLLNLLQNFFIDFFYIA